MPEQDENEDSNISQTMDGVEPGYASDSNPSNTVREQTKPAPIKKPKARDLDKVLRSKSERRMKKDAAEAALDPMVNDDCK